MKTDSDVLKKFADAIADRIVRKTVAELRKVNATLSGGDSPLQDAWEEICVKIQEEQSHFWEAYDGIAWSIISRHALKLKPHELVAVWFQTDEGGEWKRQPVTSKEHYAVMSEAERDGCHLEDESTPLCTDEVERYIQLRLYDKAESYSNMRIERFLENLTGCS
jgi:hypothetical protein